MEKILLFPLRARFEDSFLTSLSAGSQSWSFFNLSEWIRIAMDLPRPPPEAKVAALLFLQKENPELSVNDLNEELDIFAELHSLAVPFTTWSQILTDFESGDAELHLWTARILRYLSLEARFQSRAEIFFPGHILERFLQSEETENLGQGILHLSTLMSLSPLERRVVEKIRKSRPVEELAICPDEESFPEDLFIWNSEAKLPGLLEQRLRFSGSKKLLLNQKPQIRIPEKWRNFKSFLEAQEDFPFTKSFEFSGEIKDWVKIFVELKVREAQNLEGATALLLQPIEAAMFPWRKAQILPSPLPLKNRGQIGPRLPGGIRGLLESNGHQLPHLSREEKNLEAALDDISKRELSLFTSPSNTSGSIARLDLAPRFKTQVLLPEQISPSGLEALSRCSAAYLFSNIERLDFSQANEERLDPRLLGSLVHKVLEKFLGTPDFKSVKSQVEKIFSDEKSNFFKDLSAMESAFLESRTEILCEELSFHIETFEKDLFELFPARKIETEKVLAAPLNNMRIRGRVDRLDEIPSDAAPPWYLLFDYKTGKNTGKALTQVKNAKFQFFIYREMLIQLKSRVGAGGYLNPLDPEKSSLFILEDFPQLEKLKGLYSRHGHSCEILSASLLEEIKEKLSYFLASAQEVFNTKTFIAEPLTKSQCGLCDYRFVCGRPHFLKEGSTDGTT